jgi:hypothetical protein
MNLTIRHDHEHELPWVVDDNRSALRNERRAKTLPELLVIIQQILADHFKTSE